MASTSHDVMTSVVQTVILAYLITAGKVESAGKSTCRILPVKKGEAATLLCSFPSFSLSNVDSITVSGEDLHLPGVGADGSLSVVALKRSSAGWRKFVHGNFVLETDPDNIGPDGIEQHLLVTIPHATEDYEGNYICQLLGSGTPSSEKCHFLLDKTAVDILNETSVLVSLKLEPQEVHTSKEDNLLQRVDVQRLDTGDTVKSVTLAPPQNSSTINGLEINTRYELILYLSSEQTPISKTVCIPGVTGVGTSSVNASSVRLSWKPTVCGSSIGNITYHVCYKKAASKRPQEICYSTESNKSYTFINDPEIGAMYEIGFKTKIDGKIIGPTTTHEVVFLEAPDAKDEGKDGDGVNWPVFIGIGVIVAVIAVGLSGVCIYRKRRRWRQSCREGLSLKMVCCVDPKKCLPETLDTDGSEADGNETVMNMESSATALLGEVDGKCQAAEQTTADQMTAPTNDTTEVQVHSQKGTNLSVPSAEGTGQETGDVVQDTDEYPKTMTEQDTKNQMLRERNAVLEREIESLKDQLERGGQNMQMTDKLQELTVKRDQLLESIKRLDKNAEETNRKLEASTKECRHLESLLAEQTKQLQDLEQKHNEVQAERDKLFQDSECYRNEEKKASEKKNELKKKLDESRRELRHAREKIEKLESENKQLQKDLHGQMQEEIKYLKVLWSSNQQKQHLENAESSETDEDNDVNMAVKTRGEKLHASTAANTSVDLSSSQTRISEDGKLVHTDSAAGQADLQGLKPTQSAPSSSSKAVSQAKDAPDISIGSAGTRKPGQQTGSSTPLLSAETDPSISHRLAAFTSQPPATAQLVHTEERHHRHSQ